MTSESKCEGLVDKFSAKVFYTIGDVAAEVGVEQYVLRFWEGKFPQITPVKRRGRRLYDRDSIEVIKKVKYMLYDCGYTIKGAQLMLRNRREVVVSEEQRGKLTHLLHDMIDLRDALLKKLNGM